mmetsp:Transcript_47891/g.95242  ORF Transcript_47891/g.95242 Transcript_47891/m.95242 type:complete len:204 (+) Transcript_47891:84-695(+)
MTTMRVTPTATWRLMLKPTFLNMTYRMRISGDWRCAVLGAWLRRAACSQGVSKHGLTLCRAFQLAVRTSGSSSSVSCLLPSWVSPLSVCTTATSTSSWVLRVCVRGSSDVQAFRSLDDGGHQVRRKLQYLFRSTSQGLVIVWLLTRRWPMCHGMIQIIRATSSQDSVRFLLSLQLCPLTICPVTARCSKLVTDWTKMGMMSVS